MFIFAGSDSGHNPFDDFDDGPEVSQAPTDGSDEFSADLTSLQDTPDEGKELIFAEKSLLLLINYYSPNLDVNLPNQEMKDKQSNLVILIHKVLETFEFSAPSVEVCVSCSCRLVESTQLQKPCLDKMAEILKEVAKCSMTAKMFDFAVASQLLRLIDSLIEPTIRLTF